MMQPAVPETRQLREERIQRARPPSYEYGIEILATLYVVSSYYNWIHSLLTPSCYLRWYLFACSQFKDKEIININNINTIAKQTTSFFYTHR